MASSAAAVPDAPQRPAYRPWDRLTYEQASDEFGITKRHLRTLHDRGLVKSYKVGNRVTFKWQDLYDYVESCAMWPVR